MPSRPRWLGFVVALIVGAIAAAAVYLSYPRVPITVALSPLPDSVTAKGGTRVRLAINDGSRPDEVLQQLRNNIAASDPSSVVGLYRSGDEIIVELLEVAPEAAPSVIESTLATSAAHRWLLMHTPILPR